MLVALVWWGLPLCPAAEPLPLAEAMHEGSALGMALTNQFARPGGAAAADGSHVGLNLAVAFLIVALLAALRLPPPVLRRVRSWVSKLTGTDDLTVNLLEEPSFVAFFESLREGPAGLVAGAPSLATQAQVPTSAPAAAATPPDCLREFYDSTPRRLAEFRTLLSEVSRVPDESARQTKLLESFERASALRESAGLPEVLPIWQVFFALEGLLKRLSTKPADFSSSLVRTMAGALDLVEHLCRVRVKPDLVSEPPVRLLAVDDDPINRRALSLALAKLFDVPDLAPDGQTALSLAGGRKYDVIFLDVEMPGMDGYELCIKIHETELNRTTPVVFVTRHSDFASRAKSTLNGGYSHLGKPFLVFEVILKAITLVLQSRIGQGAAEPRIASNRGSAPAPGPKTSPARGLSAPLLTSDDLAPAGDPARNSSDGQCDHPEKRCAPGLATGLSLEALAPLQELQQQLQVAQQDAEPAYHPEFLGDLYLAVHGVCTETQHAALDTAFRLGSALESMLKKLLEHPKSWTPSNVQAAAAALDLFLEVCRTGANPNLAQPPVQLLVVDDDPVARRAISGTLQLAFGRPDSTESGEAALRLAREKAFDLIFLDVRMPGMDGFDACCRIHQTRHNRLTPVVFVTGYDNLDSRAKAAASGGCGFVPKQVLASQLRLVALSFILRSRLGRQIPPLEAPASLAGHASDPASPESDGPEDPSLAGALGAVN
jgi:CheY-like chemotaxis protein